MQYFPSRSWAEIDLDKLAHNMREIRKITAPQSAISAVVKADAYGHGAIAVAKTLLENGASQLAVSMVDEALELQRSGISAPILILGHTDPRRISEVVDAGFEQTVFSSVFAKQISEMASRKNKIVPIHIKIDTGMNRVGFLPTEQSFDEIQSIAQLPGLQIEGIFSHFASADAEDSNYTQAQFSSYMSALDALSKRGVVCSTRHICNSAGLMRFPEMHLDMVRAGLLIYGMTPSDCPPPYTPIDLRPAMSLKASVIQVKELCPQSTISYGRRYKTKCKTLIATIPIGYADGYARKLSNRSVALVHGVRVPVVGSICMDMCMLDVTELQGAVQVGDEAVLFGTQRYDGRKTHLSVDEIANLSDTINYEITCLVGKRVPRAYIKEGKIIHMHSCIW